jgi:4-diphosphocytidyl-2-C-methyl-D-erythritol kinase
MSLKQLLDVPAPAKLNLFLHVVGRRADGYHLLQSVFTLIDWCDTLHFERRTDGRISREDLDDPSLLPADDLVVRAAKSLQVHTGCPLGAHIGLKKTIPTQAGLGGGSSDAASTLLALNRLWQLGLDRSTLASIGLSLGADVPFFLAGQSAWVEGIGEQLTPIELPSQRYLVVKPPTGVSTPDIFRHPDLQRNSERAIIEDFAAISQNQTAEAPCEAAREVAQYGRNDLQAIASRLCPEIALGLQWLQSRGLQARMTGSGSAIFAPVTQDVDCRTLPDGWLSRHCSNLRVHPLFEWR